MISEENVKLYHVSENRDAASRMITLYKRLDILDYLSHVKWIIRHAFVIIELISAQCLLRVPFPKTFLLTIIGCQITITVCLEKRVLLINHHFLITLIVTCV